MEQFIGCDAHKKFSVFVAVNEKGQAGEAVRVPHDRQVYREFLSQLPAHSTIAVEASGYYSWIVYEMERLGHQPQLANPLEAKRRMGGTKKTDKLDARGSAVLLRNGTLPTVWIPSTLPLAPAWFWPRSRRSGCLPAEPLSSASADSSVLDAGQLLAAAAQRRLPGRDSRDRPSRITRDAVLARTMGWLLVCAAHQQPPISYDARIDDPPYLTTYSLLRAYWSSYLFHIATTTPSVDLMFSKTYLNLRLHDLLLQPRLGIGHQVAAGQDLKRKCTAS